MLEYFFSKHFHFTSSA